MASPLCPSTLVGFSPKTYEIPMIEVGARRRLGPATVIAVTADRTSTVNDAAALIPLR
jgi:hypothetical protein